MIDFTALNLPLIWFILVSVLFAGYAILDGFDLGVGALHLLCKTDEERRLSINSIGPVWDGNEVWLVTGGGALFAAFPHVYATLASGFYEAVHLLLFSLIFRAVAIEFRSKQVHRAWRQFWDISFSLSSILAAFLLGVALGNLIEGVPLRADREFDGNFLTLLNPYAILVGITTLALFMMHGAIYLVLKTEGAFHDRVRAWVKNSMIFFILCFGVLTIATLIYHPAMVEPLKNHPIMFAIPLLNLLVIANIPREIYHGRDFVAIVSSAMAMFFLIALAALGMYPNIVVSDPNPEHSLTIYNASSSIASLNIMLNIALMGIPFVLAYTISIYWIFRGKVKITKDSY